MPESKKDAKKKRKVVAVKKRKTKMIQKTKVKVKVGGGSSAGGGGGGGAGGAAGSVVIQQPAMPIQNRPGPPAAQEGGVTHTPDSFLMAQNERLMQHILHNQRSVPSHVKSEMDYSRSRASSLSSLMTVDTPRGAPPPGGGFGPGVRVEEQVMPVDRDMAGFGLQYVPPPPPNQPTQVYVVNNGPPPPPPGAGGVAMEITPPPTGMPINIPPPTATMPETAENKPPPPPAPNAGAIGVGSGANTGSENSGLQPEMKSSDLSKELLATMKEQAKHNKDVQLTLAQAMLAQSNATAGHVTGGVLGGAQIALGAAQQGFDAGRQPVGALLPTPAAAAPTVEATPYVQAVEMPIAQAIAETPQSERRSSESGGKMSPAQLHQHLALQSDRSLAKSVTDAAMRHHLGGEYVSHAEGAAHAANFMEEDALSGNKRPRPLEQGVIDQQIKDTARADIQQSGHGDRRMQDAEANAKHSTLWPDTVSSNQDLIDAAQAAMQHDSIGSHGMHA